MNTSLFSPPKKNRESINIIFVGTLCERKGIFDLLIAIPLVIKKVPSAQFTLCGNGEIDEFRLICKKQSISSHVTFTGWVNGQEKISYIRNSDVFVLPSYNEGLPVAIIEAMAGGLPIVSTCVGGIPDIINDGINGFLIQPGDIESLADRIVKLLEDKPLRDKIGELNTKKARNLFDVNVVVKQLCQIYKDLLVNS